MELLNQRSQAFTFSMIAAVIIFVAFFLRLHQIESMPPGLHPDEAQQFYRYWRFANQLAYPFYFEGAPEPFDAILRGLFASQAGLHFFSMRFISIVLNTLAVAATIGAGRAVFRNDPRRNLIALSAGFTLAILAPSLIIGRAMYRANELIFWLPLALMFLFRAWQTRRLVYFFATGLATGMGGVMYLAGPFMVLAILSLMAILAIFSKAYRLSWKAIGAFLIPLSLVFLPWIYLFIALPGWLSVRLQDFGQSEPDQISDFVIRQLDQWRRTFSQIIFPSTHYAPVYNIQTGGWLNPFFAFFFIAGFLRACRKIIFRDLAAFALLWVTLIMLVPAAVTSLPEESIRAVGAFAPIALLTGSGIGYVFDFIERFQKVFVTRLAYFVLLLMSFLSLIFAWNQVVEHYQSVGYEHEDNQYFVLLREQIESILAQPNNPTYIPLEYVNFRTVIAYLHEAGYQNVKAYQPGEPLPAGNILSLRDTWYGTPLVDHPQTFVILEPEIKTIGILAPLDPMGLVQLNQAIETSGQVIENRRGDWLYYQMPLVENDQRLLKILPSFPSADTEPLIVYDDNLELVAVDFPDKVTAGNWQAVTLFWRLKEKTSIDYWAQLQFWYIGGEQVQSMGRSVEQFSPIFGDFAPTPLWQAGQIYPQRKWVFIDGDEDASLPDGGYLWVINGFSMSEPNQWFSPEPAAAVYREPVVPALYLLGIERYTQGSDLPIIPSSALKVGAVFDEVIQLEAIEEQIEDDVLNLRLYWRTLDVSVHNYINFVHLRDASGQIIDQRDLEPKPHFPTATWQKGDLFISEYQFDLALKPDSYALGLYYFKGDDVQRAAVRGDGEFQIESDAFIIPAYFEELP